MNGRRDSSAQQYLRIEIRGGRAWLTAWILALAMASPAAAQLEFVRGDTNGDEQIGLNDVLIILSYFAGGPAPTSGCSGDPLVVPEAADVNDNEYLTIADALRLADVLFVNPTEPIAPPNVCGPDPTSGQNGFDVVDPAYQVFLGEPIVTPPTGVNRIVEYPVYLGAPASVHGLDLYFAVSNTLALSNPTFDGPDNVALEQVVFNVVILTLADPLTGLVVSPGTRFLGYLQFDLADGFEPPSIDWVPEFISGFPRRGTLVDSSSDDHHPSFLSITTPIFFRGDVAGGVDGGDGVVDPTDLAFLHSFLSFQAVPVPTSVCGPLRVLDGLDVNDNEFITIADALLLEATLGGTASIPAPSGDCGPDPSESPMGFNQRDPAYRITATDLDIVINSPADIRALIDFTVTAPLPVRAIEFALSVPPGVNPLAPALVLHPSIPPGVTVETNFVNQRLFLSIFSSTPLLPAGTDLPLGELRFALPTPVLPNPIQLLATFEESVRARRTTIVDDQFQDHHPVLGAGTVEFIRGDTNNQAGVNSPLDIGDAITIFNYLFPPEAPVLPVTCLDAVDVNNDGALDIGDAITLLGYLFGQIPTLPSPFLLCGLDTDIDLLDCDSATLCP
ncbi:MAG: hypothetical protein AB7O52_11005 [Planctomycetota bacterium]